MNCQTIRTLNFAKISYRKQKYILKLYYIFNINKEKKIFITYDDEKSVKEKCKYVKDNDLAGVMFWEYNSDKKEYLLKTIADKFKYKN